MSREPGPLPRVVLRMSSNDTIGAVLDVHAMINGFLAGAVEDVPDSRMTEQPGTIVNHPAWTLSHLNAYAGMLLVMLGDAGTSADAADMEMERYGYGTKPVRDAAAYAPKGELLELFIARNARLAGVVRATHAEYFPRRAPEKFQPYSPTIGHLAITMLVGHPGHHLGQLRQWRRAAGIAEGA